MEDEAIARFRAAAVKTACHKKRRHRVGQITPSRPVRAVEDEINVDGIPAGAPHRGRLTLS